MPQITVESKGEHRVEVPAGTRLVNAVRQAGVDIGHRCGGHAKCTTCRVEFVSGEPERRTEAEVERLEAKGLSGVRLSCQIAVDRDMTVRPVMVLQDQEAWDDAGPEPAAEIEPPPVWT